MTHTAHRRAELLPPSLMARLDSLDLLSRRILTGKLHGPRPAKRRGASIEFTDWRDYAAGDDPRFLDWNIHARLGRLMIRLFAAEEDAALHILLDAGKSCDFGEPGKMIYLKRLAAALGYVGLINQHRVTIHVMNDRPTGAFGPMRGRAALRRLIDFVADVQAGGASRIEPTCRRFASRGRKSGVCLILSDFFFRDSIDSALGYLSRGGNDIFCLQVLSPQELDPPIAAMNGNQRLCDMEELQSANLQITPRVLEAYQRNLGAHRAAVERAARHRGGNYLFTSTDVPVDKLVLETLRQRRLLG